MDLSSLSVGEFKQIFFDSAIITQEAKIIKSTDSFLVCSYRYNKFAKVPFVLDERISYLAGVILGDGNICKSKRKKSNTSFPSIRLSVFNSSNKFLARINRLFFDLFGVSGTIKKKNYCNCYSLVFNSKIVWLFFVKLLSLPVGKKSNLKIPVEVITPDLFKYFVAGLMDTDGYFSECFGIMMAGSNFDFLKSVKKYCNSFYGIEFRKNNFNVLRANNKIYTRARITVRTSSARKFIEAIPLIHERWDMGLERIELSASTALNF